MAMASRAALRRELAQASARLIAEEGRGQGRQRWPSPRIVEVEKRRILLLTGLLEAGSGHVFTPMGNWAALPSYQWTDRDIPACRRCRVPVVGDLAAKEPCAGDLHICPVVIGERRGRPVFCDTPGAMNRDLTAWQCAEGHVTDGSHVPRFRDHAKVCLLADAGCPWPFLAAAA
jgi:hypothetical protein